jgi:hypothetical protein
MDFDEVGADKAARQARLIEALTQAPADADTSARAQLEALLGREALEAVDERLLALLTESPPDPEPGLLDQVAAAQEERRAGIADVVLGRRSQSPPGQASGGLDGGARSNPQRPETHGETLLRVLSERSADAGGRL